MTLIIDRENDEVRDSETGTLVGELDGPPYSKPTDALKVVKNQFPSDHASVSVQHLMWTIDAASGNVEWANPLRENDA